MVKALLLLLVGSIMSIYLLDAKLLDCWQAGLLACLLFVVCWLVGWFVGLLVCQASIAVARSWLLVFQNEDRGKS